MTIELATVRIACRQVNVPVVLNIAAVVFPAAGSDFFMHLIAVDACVTLCVYCQKE